MRRTYNPATSLLAGRPNPQLAADLAAAQQAWVDLSTGAKVVSVSYTQGAGSRTVSYTEANMAGLQSLIRQLQAQLGIVARGRAPIRVRF